MMKKYKEGDTIYLRGTVTSVDTGFRTKADMTYQVSFSNPKSSLTPSNKVWVDDNCVIEEPVKPVLPKDVADELEDAKKNNYTFVGYMNKAIVNDYDETNRFVYLADVSTDEMIKVFSDAWYNGYTVEKPKLYNLILNDDFKGKVICLFKPTGVDGVYASYEKNDINLKHNERYQFTQEEIDKYNEDFMIKNLDLNDYKVEVED